MSAIFDCHYAVKLKEENFFDLEQLNISNAVAKYVSKFDREPDLHSADARTVKSEIKSVLFAGVKKFEKEKDRCFCSKDLLPVNSDAEKILKNRHNYFEKWAYALNEILWLSIEEFYDQMVQQNYTYENLPLILPLILFPSSEILVASCMYDFKKENFRELKAKPDLKCRVYGTDNIPEAVHTGKLDEVLSTFVIPEAIKDVYKEIPETRKIIQILSYC
ncbi:MAG: hypothetical protein R2941_20500 [Desulfobacterales bacterium]